MRARLLRAVPIVALAGLLASPAVAAEIIGTAGDDRLVGTAEADTISGAGGDDDAAGGAGADAIRGGAGMDVLRGDAGGDILKGDRDEDQLYGGTERDRLFGGAGDDLLVGEAGDDLLVGEEGTDVLRGADGLDKLYLGAGDRGFGGPQADDISSDSAATVAGGDGNDYIQAYGTAAQDISGQGGDDYVTAPSEWGTAFSVVSGGPGDDYLEGAALMSGGDGADVVTVESVTAPVPLSGDADDDMLYAGQPYDPTPNRVSCGTGVDTVVLDLEDTWAADCEQLSFTIWGTSGPDTIEGTSYADRVVPFEGDDTVRTYGGDDTVTATGTDSGLDTLVLGAGDDYARVVDGDADRVQCGSGLDTVAADRLDVVAADCERVGPDLQPATGR